MDATCVVRGKQTAKVDAGKLVVNAPHAARTRPAFRTPWRPTRRSPHVLLGAACTLLAAAAGCGGDDEPALHPAAGGSNHAGAGAGGSRGTTGRPANEECPKQAGENPRDGANCATIDNTCSVRNACGVCAYDASCDYYEFGPVWEFADPIQNIDRPECPESLPVIGSACTVSFIPYKPVCQYCDGATPVFAACLEYRWRSVTFNYCP